MPPVANSPAPARTGTLPMSRSRSRLFIAALPLFIGRPGHSRATGLPLSSGLLGHPGCWVIRPVGRRPLEIVEELAQPVHALLEPFVGLRAEADPEMAL